MDQQKLFLMKKISPRQGFALVLVVTSLVLMTILAVSFLLGTSTELATAKIYAQQLNSRRISDTVVNLAISQITSATAEGNWDNPVLWASQPGMIRTWDDVGNPSKVYKLYSSPEMVVDAVAFNPLTESAALTNWKGTLPNRDYNALWVDINSPIANSDGKRSYPVVTPPDSLDTTSGVASVAGFSVVSPPGFTGSSPTSTNNPAPMPVQWIYLLRNGQMVSPTGNATTASLAGASASNPIVARVAFWTDDETAKVNINTASEGFFWDQPHSGGPSDWRYTVNPPVRGEWQSFQGHPMNTSLSAVFDYVNRNNLGQVENLITTLSPRSVWGGSKAGTEPYGTNTANTPVLKSALKAVPDKLLPSVTRLLATVDEAAFTDSRNPSPNLGTKPLTEELRARSFFLTAASRAPEESAFNTPRISMWPVTWMALGDAGNTAAYPPSSPANPNSDSIKLNPSMMAEEKLLAFAATYKRTGSPTGVEGRRFFFQRQRSTDPNHDIVNIDRNRDLIGYLGKLARKNIPGYGQSFSSKYGGDETNQIVTGIFDKLRTGINLQTTAFSNIALNYYYTPRADRTGFTFRAGAGSVVPTKIRLDATGQVVATGGKVYRGTGRFPTISEVSLIFYAQQRQDPCPPTAAVPDGPGDPATLDPSKLITSISHRTTNMGMVMFFEIVQPMPGAPSPNAMFALRVKGSPISINGIPTGFPSSAGDVTICDPGNLNGSNRNVSVSDAFPGGMFLFWGRNNPGGTSRPKILGSGANKHDFYPFFVGSIPVDPAANSFAFVGQPVTLQLWALDPASRYNPSAIPASPDTNTDRLVQEITVDLSQLNGSYKIPIAPRWANAGINQVPSGTGFPPAPTPAAGSFEIYSANSSTNAGNYDYAGNFPAANHGADFLPSGAARPTVPNSGARNFNNRIGRLNNWDSGGTLSRLINTRSLITGYDTVISMQLSPTDSSRLGDVRMLANRFNETNFSPVSNDAGLTLSTRGRFNNLQFPSPTQHRHTLRYTWGDYHGPGLYESGSAIQANSPWYPTESLIGQTTGLFGFNNFWTAETNPGRQPVVPVVSGVLTSAVAGDWTNAPGTFSDGAVMNKPDEVFLGPSADPMGENSTVFPYYKPGYENSSGGVASFFSPSRQIPSPVLLGDVPTGVMRGQPWQTLLFNPNPRAGAGHDGFRSPPDHVWLDLFWSPAVEPYAISEAFSTAGKININYQIMPFFGYMERATGIHALMKSVKVSAITGDRADDYKSMRRMNGQDGGGTRETRFDVNIPETLKGFQDLFNTGAIFRTASQICEMYLVPQAAASNNPPGLPSTLDATKAWWNNTTVNGPTLTGANLRQKPYAALYSRVTTKSNTYRVHWRVQVLEQTSQGGAWSETTGRILSEYRGSTLVERYIDPNDKAVPDYATEFSPRPIHEFYKWRIVSNTQFNP
jgi:uncharacterized protein (TIGR02600 family)